MEKTNKKLIMFVGKTHSGKTTLANELKKENQNVLILEADPISVFMKNEFPELRENDDKEHNGTFKNVSLKFRTFLLFVEFALSLSRNIILSNSNMWREGRNLVREIARKFDYEIIGVYFDYPEDTLLDRVNISERSIDVLRTSNNFENLLINQRERMQPPLDEEFDQLYKINSESDLLTIKEKLQNLLK